MEYELVHHGIKGQRWGVRRYQKKDGSLTPAGKKRYQSFEDEARGMSDQELRSKVNRMNLEKRYVSASSNRGSSVSKATKNAASAGVSAGKLAKNIAEMNGTKNKSFDVASQGLNAVSQGVDVATRISTSSKKAKTAKAASQRMKNLNDDDLRRVVERMELEQQYSSLRKETVSRGKMEASEIISLAGSVLAVGASATAIALNIAKMRSGA